MALKINTLAVVALTIALSACIDSDSEISRDETIENRGDKLAERKDSVVFDSLYAKKLGADPIGMRSYVFAYLLEGPNRTKDSTESARLQRAHLNNISRLANEGKLVLAGPFLDDTEVKGIYIFAVETIEEARELTATDPAIQAGSLKMELHPWYGSAALMEVNRIHAKIAREKF